MDSEFKEGRYEMASIKLDDETAPLDIAALGPVRHLTYPDILRAVENEAHEPDGPARSKTVCSCGHEASVHVGKGCNWHDGCSLNAFAVLLANRDL